MYETTNWTNRTVEFPNRFIKSGESGTDVTLTPNPGTITNVGTPISSTNLNKLERGVFDAQLLAWMGGF
jgi:hypothetical protein